MLNYTDENCENRTNATVYSEIYFSFQELQNKTQGIDIPKLDLVDSEDENKGDSTDLALHEGTPRQDDSEKPKPSSSETMDSLEEPNHEKNEREWNDPPENPFAHQAQSGLDTSNRRDTPQEQSSKSQSASGSYRQYTGENTPSQRQEGFHLQADEDPRLQQMFAEQLGHQVAQYPYSGPQGPVTNEMQGSYGGYNPIAINGQFDSSRDRVPSNQYEPQSQPYEQYQDPVQQQGQYSGRYYVEANIAPVQTQPQISQQNQYGGGYMNQAPVQQQSPRRGYQCNPERDMRQVPQGYSANNGYYRNDGFVSSHNGSYPAQNGAYTDDQQQQQYSEPACSSNQRGYNDDPYAYTNNRDSVPYQSHPTYSAQSSLASKPQGEDYISKNKKNLKNPPKKSYRHMYGKKKEVENEQLFVPQGRRPAQLLNSPNKVKTPLKALPNQGLQAANYNDQNQEPMTAEEFWRQRAANLEQRKAEKLSGGGKNKYSGVTLRKYPSESRVDDIRPHMVGQARQQPHAIAEPIKSEISRSPRGQPITQTVYTEDGQRVSVDINLKLISPPPVGGPTKPFNSYYQGSPQQPPSHGYTGHGYSSQQPTLPHNTHAYGGPTNQFTYRSPHQQALPHHPGHSGRPAWGQVHFFFHFHIAAL